MTIYQPKSNEEISFCFKTAIEKIDRIEEDAKKEKTQIEADANKKKTQIVQDLAKDLEGKIATDSISNEIVHQLRGKVSETLIRRCLDEKYKEKHRVANARKQKKKDESIEDLAAPVSLNNGDIDPQKKKIIIDTSGNEISGPQPSVIEATDYDDSGKEVIAQSSSRDVTNCEQCEIKDTRIRELEDIVSKTIQITPANEIAEDKDYKIKQLQQELDERTRELDAVKHFRELGTEAYKDENHNTANIAVDFEFPLLLGDIKYHLAALYPRIGDAGKVWFSGKLDKYTGKILSIRFGRIGEDV